MEILESQSNDVTIIAVKGRLDAATAPALEETLLARIAAGAVRLVVDCTDLDYVSSAGLRVLLVAAKRLKAHDGRIAMAALKDPIKEVFDISGFSSLFAMYPTRGAALAAR